MAGRPVLLVNAVELLRVPGTRRTIEVEVDAAEVDAATPTVSGPVRVELELESSVDDIAVTGEVTIPWAGVCRRCARTLTDAIVADVDERYAEVPDDGTRTLADDVLPIERGQLDLTDLVRDETLLAAATDRLCRPDCAGLCTVCGADLNDGACGCAPAAADDRWQVLDALRPADGDAGQR